MKRALSIILAICLMISCAVMFSGCAEKKPKDFPVTFGDVTIESEPQSVVVLSDCAADIISYIGYDIKMVGRSTDCDQDFLRIVPTVGSSAEPSVDQIAQKGTDLVIASKELSAAAKAAIEANGIPVIIVSRAKSVEELEELYKALGAVLGGNVTGRAKGAEAFGELIDLLDQFNTAATGVIKTAAYIYMNEVGELCTFTKGSLEQKIFDYNGAMNTFSNQSTPIIDLNELRMGSPTCIFYDDERVIEYLSYDPQFEHLTALKKGKVCMTPLKSFYRQGTTFEQIVYEMIDFLNNSDKLDEATPDEATFDEAGYPDDGDTGEYDEYSDGSEDVYGDSDDSGQE